MSHVNGMGDSGANSGRYQLLLAVSMDDLGEPAELAEAKLNVRKSVKNQACQEKNGAGNPRPFILIEGNLPPRSGDGCEKNPHSHPDRQQYFVWRSTAGAPVLRTGMDEEPERRDRGVDDAADPGDGSQNGHRSILASALMTRPIDAHNLMRPKHFFRFYGTLEDPCPSLPIPKLEEA